MWVCATRVVIWSQKAWYVVFISSFSWIQDWSPAWDRTPNIGHDTSILLFQLLAGNRRLKPRDLAAYLKTWGEREQQSFEEGINNRRTVSRHQLRSQRRSATQSVFGILSYFFYFRKTIAAAKAPISWEDKSTANGILLFRCKQILLATAMQSLRQVWKVGCKRMATFVGGIMKSLRYPVSSLSADAGREIHRARHSLSRYAAITNRCQWTLPQSTVSR